MELDPPPLWWCLEDEIQSCMEAHPEFDREDAIEALIWGMEEDEDD